MRGYSWSKSSLYNIAVVKEELLISHGTKVSSTKLNDGSFILVFKQLELTFMTKSIG